MINSDNSIQVNIKFTFTVFEYIIVYKIVYEISVFSTLSEHTHTTATLVSHSNDFFQLALLDHFH